MPEDPPFPTESNVTSPSAARITVEHRPSTVFYRAIEADDFRSQLDLLIKTQSKSASLVT